MNTFKSIILGFLVIASVSFAKVQVEVIKLNQNEIHRTCPLILEMNETQLQVIDAILLEARLLEPQKVIFNLAYQLENGNFISFYRSEPVAIHDGDEIAFCSTEGLSLIVRVKVV